MRVVQAEQSIQQDLHFFSVQDFIPFNVCPLSNNAIGGSGNRKDQSFECFLFVST